MQTIYFKEVAVPRAVLEESKQRGFFVTSRETGYWLKRVGNDVRVRMSGNVAAQDVGVATIIAGPNTRTTFLGGDTSRPGSHIELQWK